MQITNYITFCLSFCLLFNKVARGTGAFVYYILPAPITLIFITVMLFRVLGWTALPGVCNI